jgi:NTP pyrophosphatase (non-canonical NTP hydrolase)
MHQLEKKILAHLRARKWDDLHPGHVAKSIMIEGAELLELFQWDDQTLAEVKADKAKMEAIKKELADVLIYALEMSVMLGLDTEKIIRKKLAIVAKKYPAKLMRDRKNWQGSDSLYLKIKKEYRRQGL